MKRSADFLGKSVFVLQQYPPLPIRFDADFFNPNTALWKKREYEAELAKTTDTKMVARWQEQIRHLDRIAKFCIDTDKLTYANSHGDYHIGQMIVNGDHLTVIDWTSACRLPIAFEVITSFVFASPSCIDGSINTEGLSAYIHTFTEYYPLTAYDVEVMPYVLYFWHTVCNYRPDETIAESYQPTATLVNNLLNWLYDHVEDLSDRIAADDNPMKLMSIAMKPVALPPFPLEKIEEMTELMAGDGTVYRL